MTTLENINDTVELKISVCDKICNHFSTFCENIKNGIDEKMQNDYLNNLSIFSLKKTKVYSVIDEYFIISAMFLQDYSLAVFKDENAKMNKQRLDRINLENIYNSKVFNIDIEGIISTSDILELRDIYYKCHYTYQKYKVIPSSVIKNRTKKIYENYLIFMSKCNIVDEIDKFVDFIHNFVKVYSTDKYLSFNTCKGIKELLMMISKYKNIYVPLSKNVEEVYDVCDCGTKMSIQPNTSELLCVRCGYIVTLIGSVTEESQLFAQEGNRVAHGSYDPTRHCKFWIERIQAKESTVIPEQYLEKIKRSIKKDKIENLKSISVKQFRSYLKQNNLSKLNDHIPLIKKIITGYIPPQLNHSEQQLLFIYFDKATKTYESIKPPNKKNSLYYPFLIYKILDLIIKDDTKKSGLLSCIHLQSYETLIDNDKIWKRICEKNDCFAYRPTDKSSV